MHKTITLAGGCFWGVEGYFAQLKGVLDTSVGYVDGNKKKPTYQEVCQGVASHAEAVWVQYDPTIISLEKILDHFFRIINPYSMNRQGNDIGRQYRTGIYYDDPNDVPIIQRFMEETFKDQLKRVQTKVLPNMDYEEAEAYHQDYLKKNPNGYCHIDMNLARKDEKK